MVKEDAVLGKVRVSGEAGKFDGQSDATRGLRLPYSAPTTAGCLPDQGSAIHISRALESDPRHNYPTLPSCICSRLLCIPQFRRQMSLRARVVFYSYL
jgi:hypothetical protein